MKSRKQIAVKVVLDQRGSNMDTEPKDPSKKHFYISILKSVIRIYGCLALLIGQCINQFAAAFLIAELLGVAEEL